jgi:zinc protease
MSSLTAVVLASTLVSPTPSGAGPRIPLIPFEKYTLPNGLRVILHEDHSTPIVGVNIWYHVGAKNERPGRTGFAHLFEHMMFQGSKHCDRDYFGPVQEAGGRLNGSTSQDRTNYWETVPSNYLELALWMESDRMAFLLPAMTQSRLDNQRSVVKNERRQGYENRPYGLTYETLLAAMYPPEHPYSWPTIGSMADLDKASRDDVADFFRRFYHPANASLCIAGDFVPAEAKRLISKYFGPIPAGPKVEEVRPMPVDLKEEKRIHMTDRVGLERLYVVWPTVPRFASDDAALEVLADVLAGGKTSRLEKVLVRERQIAQDVRVAQDADEAAGRMMVVATARPGHTTAELETAIHEEVRRVQDQPPSTEEIARAVNRFEAGQIRSLESVSGFGGRADQLNMFNVLRGDPGWLAKDFERYLTVTPEGVRRVARTYLGAGRVVLEVVPGRETQITPDPRVAADQAREELAKTVDEPRLPPAAEVAEDHDRQTLPKPGPTPSFALPPLERAKLSNGMEVLVVEKHELPAVSFNLVLREGRSSDPAARLGVADLMAAVWDEGTNRRTGDQIADELAGIGASLSIAADWDSSSARLFALKRHLPKALDVYGDVLRNPAFPERELDRERNMALGRLVQVRDDPNALARLAVAATLYGPAHPYGRPQFGTPDTIRSITRADLVDFYRTHVRFDHAALIAVGDITSAELVPELERVFAGWKAPAAVASIENEKLPAPPAPRPTRIVLVDRPGAAQSVISVSQVGVERKSPDYFALAVMNSVFGGQFSSRLNMNLRESKGYTYGARTMFDWRVRQPGPFLAVASVQTAVTAPALVEFLKEYRGMTGGQPVTREETDFSKTFLTRGYPGDFETPGQIARHLETLVEHGLPDDYYNTYLPRIEAVSAVEVVRVARKHLAPDHLAIIIVADRAKAEASLRKLPEGKDLEVVRFDEDFRLVPAK